MFKISIHDTTTTELHMCIQLRLFFKVNFKVLFNLKYFSAFARFLEQFELHSARWAAGVCYQIKDASTKTQSDPRPQEKPRGPRPRHMERCIGDAPPILCSTGGRMEIHRHNGRPPEQHVNAAENQTWLQVTVQHLCKVCNILFCVWIKGNIFTVDIKTRRLTFRLHRKIRASSVCLTFEQFIKPTSVTLSESSLRQSVSDSGHTYNWKKLDDWHEGEEQSDSSCPLPSLYYHFLTLDEQHRHRLPIHH